MKAATLINSLAPTNIIFFRYIPLIMLRGWFGARTD